eukprot:scaffold743_cov177-Ochromonas_danica.AAC.21
MIELSPVLEAVKEAREFVLSNQNRTEESVPEVSEDDLLLTTRYEDLLTMKNQPSLADNIFELRKLVLDHGLPSNIPFGGTSLRSKLWKIFLGVSLSFDVEEYQMKLENQTFDEKIKEDTFRTFKKNTEFWTRINEETLLRLLNAISADHGYVQGMNVLLGPFLIVMPELDSYYCYRRLLSCHMPSYVRKNLEGVHKGSALLSRLLLCLDPQLHAVIIAKLRDVSIFSIRFILTLLANMQPLSEVIRLWDAIFAFGVHFNLILFAAHLILLRERIMAESTSYGVSCVIQQGLLESDLVVTTALRLNIVVRGIGL